jgi:hypothetical protein
MRRLSATRIQIMLDGAIAGPAKLCLPVANADRYSSRNGVGSLLRVERQAMLPVFRQACPRVGSAASSCLLQLIRAPLARLCKCGDSCRDDATASC